MHFKNIVIKIGGSVLDSRKSIESIIKSLGITSMPYLPVIVHGGGKAITRWLEKYGVKAEFIDGQRVTDADTIDIVEMVLSALTNKEIVSVLNSLGLKAAGISGRDAGTASAEIVRPELGFVGEVKEIDPAYINLVRQAGLLPVISPISASDKGLALNVNADLFAAKIASSLKAECFFMMTDTGGVLKEGRLLEQIELSDIDEIISSGVASAGMIPKLTAAASALSSGVSEVRMIDYKAVTGTVIK